MTKEKTASRSLPVSKQMVWNSYLKVAAKGGSAGIDGQSIEGFNANRNDNLYKLWNRMRSGSYLPPAVRTVLIDKKQGGKRPLGIPTVEDRIAQGVVKDYLEPVLERIFHSSSFGYRPGKSAHMALEQCQENCNKYDWVLDVDIKGFFDNISHEILKGLVQRHTQEKWVLLYVGRWLEAGIEQADGSITARKKGTPQGGVISPLLANLYLHYSFDQWMEEHHFQNPFERYADDVVIHCRSKEEAEQLRAQLELRMAEFELTLHPEKTKIAYCRNYRRTENHDNISFDFLGFSFQPRVLRNQSGRKGSYLSFSCAISSASKITIRREIRKILNPRWTTHTLEDFAARLNPKIRGWLNYYTKFNRWKAHSVFVYLNALIRQWLKNKYKLRSYKRLFQKYALTISELRHLFYHWSIGITYLMG